MVKVGSMRRVQRILLIASMLVLSAGAASASWWKHRDPAKTAPQPAPAVASAMVLNAIEVGSSATPQIILKTSGAPAFTSLSPTPDQFVVDLSGTSKAASIAMPSSLPPSVSSITADEVTEMGSRLTRVTVHLTSQGTAQAAAEGNSVVVTLPAPAIAEAAPSPKVIEVPAPIVTAPVEPSIKSEPVSSVKATVLKKIETAGKGDTMEVVIATNGDASYSAFKLENPARVVIDLPGIKNKITKNSIDVGDSLVKRVRGGQFKDDVARVVIELSQTTNFNIAKSGDRLHVTFGEAAKLVGSAPAPAVKIAEAPKVTEPVKSSDVVSQVPAIADNATWKLPPQSSPGATAVIHAEGQMPAPPAPRTRRTPTPLSPTAPAPSTTENVFTEPATPVSPLAAGGARQLSAGEKVFTGEPISLNLTDADIKDVLRTFAQLTGLNIAVDPNVSGSVTVDFVDVPWDQALDLILRQNGLSYVLEGNVMRVGTLSRLSEEASANRRLQA